VTSASDVGHHDITYRDATLRSRPLKAVNALGARLARAGAPLPSLSPDKVVAAAIKAADVDAPMLADLGSDSYRDPLDRFLAAATDEADLTTFGRFLVTRMLSGALTNRLQLHRWVVEHPEVTEERIEAPWVIVGLPRTGTSLLSNLLGLDRCCSGKQPIPSRPPPWRDQRRILASPATPRISTG
jgi:hypothetical protein